MLSATAQGMPLDDHFPSHTDQADAVFWIEMRTIVHGSVRSDLPDSWPHSKTGGLRGPRNGFL